MVSIVLPAYNEYDNLKVILPKLQKVMRYGRISYEILVCDTMKPTDDTPDLCIDQRVVYLPREGGNSYGDAIRTGIRKASGEYIVIMDADGSHNPRDILKMYKLIQNPKIDVVIGSRYCMGGHTDNNFILRFMSWVLNLSYRVMFSLNVYDVSDSFRLYRAEQLKGITLKCDNFDIVEEILIKLSILNDPFVPYEVPITFRKRRNGKSKRNLVRFIISYIATMRRLMMIKNQEKKRYRK